MLERTGIRHDPAGKRGDRQRTEPSPGAIVPTGQAALDWRGLFRSCGGSSSVGPENAGDGARPVPPSLSRRYLNQQQRFTYMFTQPLQLPQLSNEQGGRLGDGRDPPLKNVTI